VVSAGFLGFTERMSELPSGWVTIRGATLRQRLRASAGTPMGAQFLGWLVVTSLIMQVATRWVVELYDWPGLVVLMSVLVLGLVLVVSLSSTNRPPSVNLDSGQLRVGRKTIAFDEIVSAHHFTVQGRKHRESYLYFGARLAPMAIVCVRSTRALDISDSDRLLVAEMLRRSSVRLPDHPVDPYDPKGKFAWMDYPSNLTRDEAIEYVLHTPESGEPVRTPARPKSIWIDED
jgi:hypothetical protein